MLMGHAVLTEYATVHALLTANALCANTASLPFGML